MCGVSSGLQDEGLELYLSTVVESMNAKIVKVVGLVEGLEVRLTDLAFSLLGLEREREKSLQDGLHERAVCGSLKSS